MFDSDAIVTKVASALHEAGLVLRDDRPSTARGNRPSLPRRQGTVSQPLPNVGVWSPS